jgi:glyoxylase-like metal-dependent hydrolase (beta-lactamase superfamily II)
MLSNPSIPLPLRQLRLSHSRYRYRRDGGDRYAGRRRDHACQADAKGWRVTDIWNTHWHPDHAGGNAAIKESRATVTGPAKSNGLERRGSCVDDGDRVKLGGIEARVLNVGGHTLGHIAYVLTRTKSRSLAMHYLRWVRPLV